MVIQGNFYRIEPINDSSPLYDLYLLRTIKSKTNPRDEFQLEGYGMPLESAIGRVIRFAINSKYKDSILSLKEYLEEYERTRNNLFADYL